MPLPIKRSDAKAHGLTRYFTGKPCAHGHVAERMVSSGACLVCHTTRKSKWDADNLEKRNAARRAWDERNPGRAQASRQRYVVKNAERVSEMKRQWRLRNPEKIKAKNDRWLAGNRGRLRQINSEWYQSNKDKAKARDVRRRVGLNRSTVSWDQELTNLVVIEAANLADSRRRITGIKWHVDHMIPLHSRYASGLHVWSNLQVIPAILNAKKHARLVLTQPGEWIRLT